MPTTTTLQIPTADGRADAFAAFPDDARQHPGVLLYTDIFGLRPAIRDIACELAESGYYVLVPHLFYRHGPAPLIDLPDHISEEARPEIVARLMPLSTADATAERVRRDADAYLGFLTARPEVGPAPVAVIGYCLGAALAVRVAAAHLGPVAAVAGFHPAGLVTEASDSPHRVMPALTARVHLGLAENDLSPEAMGEVDDALRAAGVPYTCEVYAGSVHGFTMSDAAAFSPSARQHHWDRLLPLLGRALAHG
ncbi:Carboxymethylenebutenolidase [Streptomyces sp. ADI96-02]|uniref:dienelactone hydrolase family protein n=1 Tax=Streptomyces sp. ADI96-02 TaxID=1522760 RepID=UPI000F54E7D8|nr:dienelactone hydrolase family protein [Streptomyces sp. ADI96-02]RPK69215.1 Carboxymethylenebutenolidase [Streptomyces sp. ADI96-02]